MAESKSSFLSGFRFPPQVQREATAVLYIFCRELDDMTDDGSNPAVAQAALSWWCADLAKASTEQVPEHPVNQALKTILHSFALPHREFSELIDGMQMDLGQACYNSFDDLKLYCRRAVGMVGRLITRVSDFTQPQILEHANKMGLALQLTNTIRDVSEDARKGRVCLLVGGMQHSGVPVPAVMRSVSMSEFAALMTPQIDRAYETYRQAVPLLSVADKKPQKVGLIMAAIYYVLLDEIKRDDAENVLTYRITIPLSRKKRIVLEAWSFESRP